MRTCLNSTWDIYENLFKALLSLTLTFTFKIVVKQLQVNQNGIAIESFFIQLKV